MPNVSYTSPAALWSAVPVLTLTIFTLIIVGNIIILVLFVKEPSLRTTFSIYLMNLMTSNVLYALFENLMDIVSNLYNGWFMGYASCSLYIYALYFLSGVQVYSHALITINRLWALLSPLTYRHYHSRPVACGLCLTTWAAVHVTMMPGFICDTLYYRKAPLEIAGCYLNSEVQTAWATAVQFLVYLAPEVLMLSAYPVLWWKQKQRTRIQTNDVIFAGESIGKTSDVRSGRDRKTSKNAFLILSLTTLSVFVFWTPLNLLNTVAVLGEVESATAYQVTTLLNSAQSVMDPIVFTLALKDLRIEFKKSLLGSRS